MLTLQAAGAESLWDEILPEEVRVLPDDLARLDELLSDSELLAPIAQRWERELAQAGQYADRGRPSLAMDTYVRLMVLKHRSGWGYETLMREVSDSIHLRKFCRLGLSERVADESTVRKLTRRLGAEVVHELTRLVDPEGSAGEAVSPPGCTDRLDRGRGRYSGIRPTPVWRPTGCGRWLGRAASLPPRSRPSAPRCGIARGLSGCGCGRWAARSVVAPGRPRRRCWS